MTSGHFLRNLEPSVHKRTWQKSIMKKERILSLIGTIVLPFLMLLGIYDYLQNFEENNCEMTYMYEMPEYIPISLNAELMKKYRRYKLYAYGEGRYAESLRDRNFNGIPVLFIPGNAGSYKQVRSLGSVAYRMSVNYPFYFNYFTVDMNEEYSALFGSSLQLQTEFVHECIKRILKVYKLSNPSTPCSVILVGHSMGGVIARALFALPEFDASSINFILTQASPHQPFAFFDHHLKKFYDRVNNHWTNHRNSSLSHVNFVSIGGGHRDVMVRSSLTNLPQEYPFVMDLYRLTSAIPKVWLSTDHNGIVWCKQLVLTIQRAMFDLIDPQTKQINTDSLKRASILHYHFVRKTSHLPHEAASRLNTSLLVNPAGKWTEQRKSSWSYIQSKVTLLNYFAVPIRRGGNFVVVAKHVPLNEWLFLCKTDQGSPETPTCGNGHVVTEVRLLPSSAEGDRRFAMLQLQDWREFTHVVVNVEPSTQQVEVHAEVYDPEERHVVFAVPYLPYNLFFKSYTIDKTAWNALFYKVTLEGFTALWQAYKVQVLPRTKNCKSDFDGLMRFHVPWNEEDIFTHIRPRNLTYTVVKLQSPKPSWHKGDPELHFFLDPRCSYRIAISVSLSDIMGQIVRFYSPILLVLVVSVLIEALAAQLSAFLNEGKCPPLLEITSAFRILYNVTIPSYIILYVSRLDEVVDWIEFLPHLKDYPPETRDLHFTSTLVFLFTCAFILVQLLARVVLIPVRIIGRIASLIFYTYLKRDPGHLRSRPQFPLGPTILSASLISCAYTFCGAPCLLFAGFVYLVKVGSLYGKLKNAFDRGRDIKFLSVPANIQLTLLLLCLVLCVLHIPCLMAWAKNFKFDIHLHLDHSFIPTAIVIASLAFCWDEEGPLLRRSVCLTIVWMLRILSVTVTCFTIDTLYRLTPFICTVFILVDILYLLSTRHDKQD